MREKGLLWQRAAVFLYTPVDSKQERQLHTYTQIHTPQRVFLVTEHGGLPPWRLPGIQTSPLTKRGNRRVHFNQSGAG